jgi:hypothetical protein
MTHPHPQVRGAVHGEVLGGVVVDLAALSLKRPSLPSGPLRLTAKAASEAREHPTRAPIGYNSSAHPPDFYGVHLRTHQREEEPLGYEQSQGRLTCPDWMHSRCSVGLLSPGSSILSQPMYLVAQRLVTAVVTRSEVSLRQLLEHRLIQLRLSAISFVNRAFSFPNRAVA